MLRTPSALLVFALGSIAQAALGADLLVADRLTNSVYRYSATGELLGTVLTDNENLNQPSGMALSPDRTKLYVSSYNSWQVVRYDYNPQSGTATNPTVFARLTDGISAPGGIALGDGGQTVYIANLGGTGVARFNADGSSAGPPLMLGPPEGNELFQFSGLAWGPGGNLLVGAFIDYPAGSSGAIASWQVGTDQLELAIGPSDSLNGATGLLVDGNNLYVSGMFAHNVQRFDMTTGLVDPGFLIEEIDFPQSVVKAPDGNGLLISSLGISEGAGSIFRYDFDGQFIETWASPSVQAFQEPSALLVVPDPIAGDFNDDGSVDAIDYTIWRNTLGSTSDLRADANGDMKIDIDDYIEWKAAFIAAGSAGLTAPVHSVPEPAGIATLLITLLAAARGFVRGRRP
jgi:DNA-binding beta-propeller fold protein YncE